MVVLDKLKSLRGEGSLEIIARLRGKGGTLQFVHWTNGISRIPFES